jgi:hypothetical protein
MIRYSKACGSYQDFFDRELLLTRKLLHQGNLVTNPVISREWRKDREVFTTSRTYPWSFVTQIFHNGQPSHGGDRKICVCFVYRCLSFCPFSFDHCVVCSSSIYGFWFPLWYLQTLLNSCYLIFSWCGSQKGYGSKWTYDIFQRRYQRGNQNPYIEEEQTTQWSKEKGQKDKQRYTKHTHKIKDRVTRTPLKTGGEHWNIDINDTNLNICFVWSLWWSLFYLKIIWGLCNIKSD